MEFLSLFWNWLWNFCPLMELIMELGIPYGIFVLYIMYVHQDYYEIQRIREKNKRNIYVRKVLKTKGITLNLPLEQHSLDKDR